MPVIAFGLKNFMAFGAAGFGLDGFVEFRKINLLYGRNSHGKSVMIRALRLLKQSLSASDDGPLRFADAGGVDLGSFAAVLHKSPQETELRFQGNKRPNWSRPISFRFRCEITRQQLTDTGKQEWEAIKEISDASRGDDVLCFEVSLSYSAGEEKGIFLVGVDLWLAAHLGNQKRRRLLTLQRDPDLEPEWSGYSDANLPTKNSVALASYFSKDCLDGFLPALGLAESQQELAKTAHDQLNEIVLVWGLCRKEIENFLNSILYIGPIRPLPVRYYLIDRRENSSAYWEGAQAYRDYLLDPTDSKHLQQRLDYWVDKFELGRSVRLNKENQVNTTDKLVSIRELLISEDKKLNEDPAKIGDRNLRDMGFGASQILPIIVSCLDPKTKDAFIIIEQPELHLHPEAQADSAGLFIECVNEYSGEDTTGTDKELARGQRRANKSESQQQMDGTEETQTEYLSLEGFEKKPRVKRRCLIETHSEHLLLMFRRYIAETALYELQLEEQKEIKDAPEHLVFPFGGEDFGLIYVLRDQETMKSKLEYVQADDIGYLMSPSLKFRRFFSRDEKDSRAFALAAAEAANWGRKEKHETRH